MGIARRFSNSKSVDQ